MSIYRKKVSSVDSGVYRLIQSADFYLYLNRNLIGRINRSQEPERMARGLKRVVISVTANRSSEMTLSLEIKDRVLHEYIRA